MPHFRYAQTSLFPAFAGTDEAPKLIAPFAQLVERNVGDTDRLPQESASLHLDSPLRLRLLRVDAPLRVCLQHLHGDILRLVEADATPLRPLDLHQLCGDPRGHSVS